MSIENNQSVASDVLDHVCSLIGADRCRMRDYGKNELPARNVIPDDNTPSYNMPGYAIRTFRFDVRHIVQAIDKADKVADQQYVLTAQKLFANPTLGDLVSSLHEVKTRWEMERGELQQMALVVTYEVELVTSRIDPRQRIF